MPVKRQVKVVLKNPEGGYLILQDTEGVRGLLTATQQYDEEPEDAAKRRVEEAVDIPLIQVKGTAHTYQYVEDDITYRVTALLAETQRKQITINDENIDDAGWVEGQTLLSAVDSEDERDAVQAALDLESMEEDGDTGDMGGMDPGPAPGPGPEGAPPPGEGPPDDQPPPGF